MPRTKKVAETPTATRTNSNIKNYQVTSKDLVIKDLARAINRLADAIEVKNEKKRRLF